MAKLILVQLVDRPIQFLQQLQPIRGDARFDYPPIFYLALAEDEFVTLHTIQQASDIRIARNHSFADAAAEQAVGLRATKYAQYIVLGGREASGLNELFRFLGEGIGRLQDRHEQVILEVRSGAGGVGSRTHASNIVVITTIVKRKVLHCRKCSGGKLRAWPPDAGVLR